MSLPPFLRDRRFLHQIDHLRIKQQYVKITVLNWKEQPIQQIQGICISGNLNVDSSSAMRRTATLSILADQVENDLSNLDSLFALNKKCKLELGIKNTVSPYIFTTNDTTTTIDYQKVYGNIIWFPLGLFVMFNPSISHGLDGTTISMNLKDKMCLLNGDIGGVIPASVNFSYQDQQVNDLNGISVIKKYVLIYNIIKQLVNHWGNEILSKIIISEVPLRIKMDMEWTSDDTIYLAHLENNAYYLTYTQPDSQTSYREFSKGDVIGFIYSDFIYPPSLELVSNPGDTVTSILDKIISIMGNYQYFYDIQGNFIFQQQRNFLNMSYTAYWLKESQNGQYNYQDIPAEQYNSNLYALGESTYNLSQNQLVINYNPSLNYNNIKNDFVVFGSKKVDNYERIYRYHLAIDKKPDVGQSHEIYLYKDDFDVYRAKGEPKDYAQEMTTRVSTDWREEIYYQALEAEVLGLDQNSDTYNTYANYYAELLEQFPKIFDLNGGQIANGWKDDIVKHPQNFEYYLDFIDTGSQLGKYSISNIGRRSIVINGSNQKINCTFEPLIPDVVYVNAADLQNEEYAELIQSLKDYGQNWTNISSSMYSQLITATTPNSCYEKIKDLLYQHTNMADTISLSCMPIYYLQPNTIITLADKQSGIQGDYLIKSMTIPLGISETMNINAYKVLDKI